MSPRAARGVVHEIRGELTAVRGHAELLLRGGEHLTEAMRREFALRIEEAGGAIDALLDGIGSGPLGPALDALIEPLTVLDGELRVVYANAAQQAAWRSLFGDDLQIGSPLLAALEKYEHERARAESLLGRALAGERFTVTRTAGTDAGARRIETTYTPVRGTGDEVVAVVTLVRDLGVDGSAASGGGGAPLPAAERPSLAGRLSHQLRSPAHTLLGYADILAERPGDPVALAEIQRAARRLVRFSDDLLLFARLDDTRSRVSIEPVDLREAALRAVASTRALAEERGVRVEVDVPDGMLALTDRSSLVEALAEVLDNAVRHGGSAARITAEETDDTVALLVGDDGPGIPAALRDRALEAFVAAPRAGDDGIGLGLALAAHTLELVGGTLTIEAPPTGACVKIALARPDARHRRDEDPADHPVRASDLRVLLVEDNVGAARLVRSALALRPGIDLTVTGTVAEALSAVEGTAIDLALIDLHLPDGSGFSVIEALRRRRPEVTVAVLTADATASARENADQLGAVRFLTKPFAIDDLLRVVDGAVT